jgi:hypothetical protein
MLLYFTLTPWLSTAVWVKHVACKRALNHQDHEASDLTQESRNVILSTGFARICLVKLCKVTVIGSSFHVL